MKGQPFPQAKSLGSPQAIWRSDSLCFLPLRPEAHKAAIHPQLEAPHCPGHTAGEADSELQATVLWLLSTSPRFVTK